MISPSDIRPFRHASADWAETEDLKEKIRARRTERDPFFLKSEEFDEILRWKLAGQYGRQQGRREQNTDGVIRTVTEAAFRVDHPDVEYLAELRIRILMALRGVGIPVASAVLALVYPDCYAVIDFRGWNQIFGEEGKRGFTVPQYLRYLHRVRTLSEQLGWSVQEADLAIWAYDEQQARQPTG